MNINQEEKINNLYHQLLVKLESMESVEKDIELVKKAFEFAKFYHKDQKRISGEPFIIHPLETALILSDYYMDTTAISAALLHDVVEDTNVEIKDIYSNFGKEIGFLVESLTKLQKITSFIDKGVLHSKNKDLTLLNLKRLFISTSRDIRVIIIKLADRLHNLRTISFLPPEKQKRIALETLEFYVPISQKLGIWKIKSEMEDIAFQIHDPETYNTIKSYIEQTARKIESNYHEMIETLKKKLKENQIEATLQNRIKTVYSIYNKMVKRKVPLDEILDIGAVRVIVNEVKECYIVLGMIHNLWIPIPERIDDYIAKPKSNGYQSLHTVVYNGYPVEFQIRTWNMHYTAEFGIASHWKYKGIQSLGEIEKIINHWKKELERMEDAQIEEISQEIFQENIFVFTPKGDCIDLPRGSTPLDFAYRIHTEIGNKCQACKVNGKIVPLDYQLKNGDIVEIITSKNASPTPEWLKIVKTNYAKNRIKQFLKQKNKKEYIAKAKEVIFSVLKSLKQDFKDFEIQKIITQIFEKYYKDAYKEEEDFLLAIGIGSIKQKTIYSKIKQFLNASLNISNISNEELRGPNAKIRDSDKLSHATGIFAPKDKVFYRFAKCCNPSFPDPIVGYITRGNGISIHHKECKNVKNLSGQIMDLKWDEIKDKKILSLSLTALDRKGLLKSILDVLSSKTVNLVSVDASVSGKFANIKLWLEVPKNLNTNKLKMELYKKIPDITKIKD